MPTYQHLDHLFSKARSVGIDTDRFTTRDEVAALLSQALGEGVSCAFSVTSQSSAGYQPSASEIERLAAISAASALLPTSTGINVALYARLRRSGLWNGPSISYADWIRQYPQFRLGNS
jgi:hypothetical protein